MPKTPKENERIKKERRQQILNAGLKIFAKNGITASRISDIAKEAGVSYGLVYNYFSSKEDIFIEIVNNAFKQSEIMIGELKRLQLPPLERLKLIFIQLFKMSKEDSSGDLFYRAMLQMTFHPHLWDKTLYKDIQSDPVFRYLFETIKEGQKDESIFGTKPEEITLILGYIALGTNIGSYQIFDKEIETEAIVDLIIDMIKKK